MGGLAGGRFRTRHRNTVTPPARAQILSGKGGVDLGFDAYEYSERIVSDFSDGDRELDERASPSVERSNAAGADEFLIRAFTPDVAIRLSADSVENYRDEISELDRTRSKRKRRDFKRQEPNATCDGLHRATRRPARVGADGHFWMASSRACTTPRP